MEHIQAASDLLAQVPSMGFDRLRPVLQQHGLSEVGTLGELSARVTKVLEGKIKAAGEGGGLSKFGERAARMLFRMADKVSPSVDKGKTGKGGCVFSDTLFSRARLVQFLIGMSEPPSPRPDFLTQAMLKDCTASPRQYGYHPILKYSYRSRIQAPYVCNAVCVQLL